MINKDPNFWLAAGGTLNNMAWAPVRPMGDMGAPMAQYNQTVEAKQKEAAAKQEALMSQNKTAQYVQSLDPELGAAIQSGAISAPDAYKMILQRKAEAAKLKPWYENYKEVGGKLLGPPSGADAQPTVVYDPGPKPEDIEKKRIEDAKMEMDVNKMYRGEEDVQSYQGIKAGFEKIRTAATRPSGASDLSMVFGYMKMLDPTSVVREGEAASLRNAAGVPDQVMSLYNRVLNGEQLPENLRAEIVNEAQNIYTETSKNLEDRNKYYSDLASRGQINPGFMMQPEKFEPLKVGQKAVVDMGGKQHEVEKLSD